MKKFKPQINLLILLLCISVTTLLQAQTDLLDASTENTSFIDKVRMSENELTFKFKDNFKRFDVKISGPENLNLKENVQDLDFFTLTSAGLGQTQFMDGRYQVEITPNFEGSEAEQKVLRYLTETGQMQQLKAEKELLGIPLEVNNYNWSFSILNGAFVLPKNEAYGLKVNPELPQDLNVPTKDLASLRLATENSSPTFTSLFNQPKPQFVDIQHLDDVIIGFSLCVGNDCVNGESFGFDTNRLKENNLRIHFDDTSSSASFPSNDWRIVANDTSNGGANYLAFEDSTSGRTAFKIEAGAPSNALLVDDAGRLGIGTANPVVKGHMVDGNTPTFRLEQDGSSGFTTQIWDLASNESNFFIRDVTNASALVFRIKPGADENSLFIAANNHIGLGSDSPSKALHIRNEFPHIRLDDNAGTAQLWDIQAGDAGFIIHDETDSKPALTVTGDQQLKLDQYTGTTFDNAAPAFALTLDASGNVTKSAYSSGGGGSADADWLKTDNSSAGSINDEIYTLGKVAIGGTTLEQELHVTGNVAISGSILPVSDARLKKDVLTIDDGLATIQKLRPTSYLFKRDKYKSMNLLAGTQYGFIAQELEQVLPNLVTNSNNPDKSMNFKRVNYTGVIPFLVSGMQEQQAIIDAQQKEIDALTQKVNELDALKAQVAALAKLVSSNNQTEEESATTVRKDK